MHMNTRYTHTYIIKLVSLNRRYYCIVNNWRREKLYLYVQNIYTQREICSVWFKRQCKSVKDKKVKPCLYTLVVLERELYLSLDTWWERERERDCEVEKTKRRYKDVVINLEFCKSVDLLVLPVTYLYQKAYFYYNYNKFS